MYTLEVNEVEEAMNLLSFAWPFLILVGIMYFFMYRPTKKMKLERGRFLLSLKKGDHVVTSGGIHGTIKVLRDKYVELEIAPKVIIKVEKSGIQHGDTKLMDEKEAIKKGAAEVGEAAEAQKDGRPVDDKAFEGKKDEPETEVVEEVVEVDDPKDAGTEVIEEEVEVDDDKKPAAKDSKPQKEAKK